MVTASRVNVTKTKLKTTSSSRSSPVISRPTFAPIQPNGTWPVRRHGSDSPLVPDSFICSAQREHGRRASRRLGAVMHGDVDAAAGRNVGEAPHTHAPRESSQTTGIAAMGVRSSPVRDPTPGRGRPCQCQVGAVSRRARSRFRNRDSLSCLIWGRVFFRVGVCVGRGQYLQLSVILG